MSERRDGQRHYDTSDPCSEPITGVADEDARLREINADLLRACKFAMRISELWRVDPEINLENPSEGRILDEMSRKLEIAIAKAEENRRGEQKMNQCDGCRRCLPIVDGVHLDFGYDMIGCTKDRYEEENEQENPENEEE